IFKLNMKNEPIVHLEEIQDAVEETLMNLGMTDVARSYIRYRFQREQIRNDKKAATTVEKMIKNYIREDDWEVRENSNIDYSLQGLNNYIVTNITREFWLNYVFSPEQRKAHEEGDLHIHDLGILSTYCCGWDLEALLLKGFTGVKNKIQSKPPKHFKTALGQLVNFFYTLQGEAAGAQAVSNFDTLLAPFIRYDNLSYKEVKQAMQEFIFNLNVPTRVGFQTPFVNITMDITVSPLYKDKPIIIGGEYKEEKYGDFQKEMNMINRAFCEIMVEGDASGRVFTFPIPTYNITKDFDWDNEVVDDIMKMTSKYGIPYFSNFVNSDMKPEDARSMCCRLRLDNRELRKRGGGLFGANPLTGSIGVVTINLPRLGYLYKTKSEFKETLRILMDIAKGILEARRKLIEKNTQTGLYPYSAFYLSDVYERFGEYWKNHFNTIGIVGMNECIRNFYNDKENITTQKGQKFANDILDFMRKVITEYQKDGDLYNLEATPAESTAYRLAKKDKEKYPDIITAGDKEPYYTNSSQLPVGYTDDLFEALNLQDSLQAKYTGGTVFHAYLGEKIDDYLVTKNIIKNIFRNYTLPYFSITPTFSICKDHGYLNGEQFKCPECGSETEVWTRVVGFYRPVQNFNKGKQEEYKDRLEFVVETK
ncbi:MAG TPA: ribonucleoside triphosphate reductase, partial [Tenericutes bacterium]|nr:ribonucleoside triphosphate reductase [Mycoplasmatota bacterium]